MNRKKRNKGFTLVELMIVVAIIAILAATVAPRLGTQVKKAKDAKGIAIVGALRSASVIYYADNDGVAASTTSALISEIDTKSQDSVTSDSGIVYVAVGTNADDGPTGKKGTTSSDKKKKVAANSSNVPVIKLGKPDENDGSIDIENIGTAGDYDTKGKEWTKY